MTDTTTTAHVRVGHVLRGKWRLDALLGVGGMAAVYAATHRNGRRGAVKILHPQLALHAETRARFLREGYVANAVGHRGAVEVLDDDVTEDGSVFLVMELLEGDAVEDLLQRLPGFKMEPLAAARIGLQLCEVLAVAHEKGIVHRDLKPENLFVTREGTLKVLDFGIARLRTADGSGSTTRTGSMMGTPAYMAPEQALGEWDRVDGRTDLWAVGATLFSMLSGRPVHEDETVSKVLLRAMTKPAAPLVAVAPEVSPELCAVVDRALEFDPDARWSSAAEMGTALAAYVRRASSRSSVVFDPLARTAVMERNAPNAPAASSIAESATISAAEFAGESVAAATGPATLVSNGTPPAREAAGGGTFAATSSPSDERRRRVGWPLALVLALAVLAAAGATWRALDAPSVSAVAEPAELPTAEPSPSAAAAPASAASESAVSSGAPMVQPSASALQRAVAAPRPRPPPVVRLPAPAAPSASAKPLPSATAGEPTAKGFEGRH